MRILLAEDDEPLAERLKPLLAQAGYVVTVARDGREAEELGQIEEFEAAVVDLGLPSLDGISIIERWRANGRTLPVCISGRPAAKSKNMQGTCPPITSAI